MKVRFWGVRGSLPSPQLPSQIKDKVSAILERVTPEDLESAAARERFLAGLPPWLFGTAGGNTPCISVHPAGSTELLVFDCGSGIRELGIALSGQAEQPSRWHIFLSHFHWDHIMGLPFFNPAYNPANTLDFYSPLPELEKYLYGQMIFPYFPIKLDAMASKKTFHFLEVPFEAGGLRIEYRKMNHPGGSYSYKVREGEKTFIYATDTELAAEDFMKTEENAAYFEGADLIVLDSQYTLGEAIDKYNWGHSAFSLAVDFAANWGIKHMVMFHHDPAYSDRKLYEILQSARWYLERMNIKGLELSLAVEGMEIEL
jgi:phosphoribosyl 1,2-cyclic phosphodiesterase